MSKYLELVGGYITQEHLDKQQNQKPYVVYSIKDGKVIYSIVPNETGPSDNEIWYTTSDGNVVTPLYTGVFGANIISNTYENDKGVIKFDNSVTSIGQQAFMNCSSLTSIVIPDSVTRIGVEGGAFDGCSSLTSIIIPVGETIIRNYAFRGCSSLTSIVIPDSVTRIGHYAFSDCSSLTSITIPNSVREIGHQAFSWCSALTSVVIPVGMGSIENSSFLGCSSLSSITIPNSVTSIGDRAFMRCSKLADITIPDSVTSIRQQAFSYCDSLTSITFKGTIEQWNSISKDTNWNQNASVIVIHCADGDVTL